VAHRIGPASVDAAGDIGSIRLRRPQQADLPRSDVRGTARENALRELVPFEQSPVTW